MTRGDFITFGRIMLGMSSLRGGIAPTMVRGRWRTILLSVSLAVTIVVLLQPLFVFSLVWMRNHTDLQPIRAHIAQAFDQRLLADEPAQQLLLHRGGHLFTECTAMNILLDNQTDFVRTAVFPMLHGTLQEACGAARRAAIGAPTAPTEDYARYWHGYRIYLWPLLEQFSLALVRLINALLILAAICACFFAFRTVIGAMPATVFIVVLLSLTDLWLIWRNSPHAISMIVILLGVAVFGMIYNRTRSSYFVIAFAAFCGAIFNFVDFLVNPPMMPMLMAFLVLAAQERPAAAPPWQPIGSRSLAALAALSWFGAYALTWITKWYLAIWYSDDAARTKTEILTQIMARLYGSEPNHPQNLGPEILALPLLPTIRMIGKSFISYGSVVVVVLAIAMYFHLRDNWNLFDRKRFLVLVSPTLIAVGWFELLSNHTQTHIQFTYRSASAAIAIVFAAALMATKASTSIPRLIQGLRRIRLRGGDRISAPGKLGAIQPAEDRPK